MDIMSVPILMLRVAVEEAILLLCEACVRAVLAMLILLDIMVTLEYFVVCVFAPYCGEDTVCVDADVSIEYVTWPWEVEVMNHLAYNVFARNIRPILLDSPGCKFHDLEGTMMYTVSHRWRTLRSLYV